MKFRNGFVSNSSSSSFIIAFDKYPQNVKELQSKLFGKNEFVTEPYSSAKQWATRDLAERIFTDLEDSNKFQSTFGEIVDLFRENAYSDIWDEKNTELISDDDEGEYRSVNPTQVDVEYDGEEVLDRAYAYAKKFYLDNKDCLIFMLDYGDHEDIGCMLEHGEVFKNIPHERFSHH